MNVHLGSRSNLVDDYHHTRVADHAMNPLKKPMINGERQMRSREAYSGLLILFKNRSRPLQMEVKAL